MTRRKPRLGLVWLVALATVLSPTLLAPPPATAHIVVQGGADFQNAVEECLEKILAAGGQAAADLNQVLGSNNVHSLSKGSKKNGGAPNNAANASNGTGTGTSTSWDPNYTDNYNGDTTARDPCASLAHELSHMADCDKGNRDTSPGHNGIPKDEIKACGSENEYRDHEGLPKRNKYGGKDLP